MKIAFPPLISVFKFQYGATNIQVNFQMQRSLKGFKFQYGATNIMEIQSLYGLQRYHLNSNMELLI